MAQAELAVMEMRSLLPEWDGFPSTLASLVNTR
jgi:hypothetical protein